MSKSILERIKNYLLSDIRNLQTDNILLTAKLFAENNNRKAKISSLREGEFKVFSQFGEDGIIQYLIDKIDIPNKIFIEFGVQNYTESNTRFLLMNNYWRGLVIDGSKKHIDFIQNDDIYWRFGLTAVNQFITEENINQIIKNYTSIEDIGLLSIDLDGNDYWIWKAIDAIKPRIVICEYNSLFGSENCVTIPYKKDFVRSNYFFWGTSLSAIYQLAVEKGYDFIGTNSAGNNAFFLRSDINSSFNKISVTDGFTHGIFDEKRGGSLQTNIDLNEKLFEIGRAHV